MLYIEKTSKNEDEKIVNILTYYLSDIELILDNIELSDEDKDYYNKLKDFIDRTYKEFVHDRNYLRP